LLFQKLYKSLFGQRKGPVTIYVGRGEGKIYLKIKISARTPLSRPENGKCPPLF